MSQDITNGFHDRAMLDGAGGARGKQRGEEEEVSRRHDDDIVILGVEVLQERHSAPASTCCRDCISTLCLRELGGLGTDQVRTKHNECFLIWIGFELFSRIAQMPNAVTNPAKEGGRREICHAP